MSQESKSPEDMRPEYDIRGGVRGKYFERSTQEVTTVTAKTFVSPLVVNSTSTAVSVGTITRSIPYPSYHPSLKIQLGSLVLTADAG